MKKKPSTDVVSKRKYENQENYVGDCWTTCIRTQAALAEPNCRGCYIFSKSSQLWVGRLRWVSRVLLLKLWWWETCINLNIKRNVVVKLPLRNDTTEPLFLVWRCDPGLLWLPFSWTYPILLLYFVTGTNFAKELGLEISYLRFN